MLMILIAIEVLAVVASLALPMARDGSLRSRAASIARDMVQVREASLRVRAGQAEWPSQPAPGAVPALVATELPPGFSFKRPGYKLVWERWSIDAPEQLGLDQPDLAGVTLIADDPRLAALVACELPAGPTRFTIGNHTTLVIDGRAAPR